MNSINSLTPDNHGGNMDLPDMGHYYLFASKPGWRLFKETHACKEMESLWSSSRVSTTTTIRVDLIKNYTIEWPRLETENMLMAIGSTRPLEDATRIAYRELVRWLAKDYKFDQWDIYMILSQVGKVRLGNFVDPKYTVGAGIEKKYLK